jgi:hypothetical protein
MSLLINVDKIRDVLIEDEWHTVYWNDGISTFNLDSYEFMHQRDEDRDDDFLLLLGGGQCDGVPSTGFAFQECAVEGLGDAKDQPGDWIFGPLTSIKAVRTWPHQRTGTGSDRHTTTTTT